MILLVAMGTLTDLQSSVFCVIDNDVRQMIKKRYSFEFKFKNKTNTAIISFDKTFEISPESLDQFYHRFLAF